MTPQQALFAIVVGKKKKKIDLNKLVGVALDGSLNLKAKYAELH